MKTAEQWCDIKPPPEQTLGEWIEEIQRDALESAAVKCHEVLLGEISGDPLGTYADGYMAGCSEAKAQIRSMIKSVEATE